MKTQHTALLTQEEMCKHLESVEQFGGSTSINKEIGCAFGCISGDTVLKGLMKDDEKTWIVTFYNTKTFTWRF